MILRENKLTVTQFTNKRGLSTIRKNFQSDSLRTKGFYGLVGLKRRNKLNSLCYQNKISTSTTKNTEGEKNEY